MPLVFPPFGQVSSVQDMSGMFSENGGFNQDLPWNTKTANVKNMQDMFSYAFMFNGNVGGWDVGSVTSFTTMFMQATSFNQNLSNWRPRTDASMIMMFHTASNYQQGFCDWFAGPPYPTLIAEMTTSSKCTLTGLTFDVICGCVLAMMPV